MRRGLTIRYSSIINILVALIIVCYVGPFASYKGSLVLISFLGVVLLVMSGITGLFSKKYLTIWAILSIYLVWNSVVNFPNSIKYLLVFFVGYALVNRNLSIADYKQVFSICKIAAILDTFLTLIQYYAPGFYYPFAQKWFFYSNQYEQVVYMGQYVKQFSGLFYEVSFSALILSFGIIIYVIEMFEEVKKSRKIVNFIVALLSYYAVILTGKRSFMLIIPVVVALLYLIKDGQKLTVKHLIVVFIGVMVLVFSMDKLLDVFFSIISKGSGHTADLSSRELFWGLALDMFKESPLIGKGLNSFDIAFNASGIRAEYYDFAGTHNSYIQLLSETGIIGFVLYMAAIIHSMYKGIKTLINGCKDKIYLYTSIGMILVMLVYALSGNALYQPQQLITFFWLIAVVENYNQNMKTKNLLKN